LHERSRLERRSGSLQTAGYTLQTGEKYV